MPIYEYRCESCGHTLDALQKIADAPLSDCPSCDEAALKRLISAPVFRLKGKGWYETDFKSDKETRRNLADRADGEAKPDKPKDAKPDKKSDEKPAAASKKPETGGKSAGGAKAASGRQTGSEAA